MVNLLPLYDPLRLTEEFAMLDHLTHGRLNIGIGSGIRPDEFARFMIPVSEAKPRFYESVEFMVRAFTQDHFDFDGHFYHYRDVVLVPKPLQLPFPPIVVAAQSADTVRWCAERRLPISQMYLPRNLTKERVALYQASLTEENGRTVGLNPSVRHFRPVYVAETTGKALADAEKAYFRFFQLFSRSEDPAFQQPSPDAWRHHVAGALRHLIAPQTFEELDAENITIFGDPDRVIQKLQQLQTEEGMDGLGGMFVFGDLPHDKVVSSMRLFAHEVMPAFRRPTTGPAPHVLSTV